MTEPTDPVTTLALRHERLKSALPSAKDCLAESQTWNRRFTLSIAVANGAGLIAVMTALTQEKLPTHWAMLVPSAWLFAAGVTAAGIVPVLHSTEMYIASAIAERLEKGVQSYSKADDDLVSSSLQRGKRLELAADLIKALAALLLVLGMIIPLIALTSETRLAIGAS